jgi:hypothetical protein
MGGDFRPCEAGKPKPTDENYIVYFEIVRPFLSGSENDISTLVFREPTNKYTELLFPSTSSGMEFNKDGLISGSKDYRIDSDDDYNE